MIYNFDRNVPDNILKPTICIIGSGAIGLTLAHEFASQSSLDVVILEAGEEQPGDKRELEIPLNSGDIHSGVSGSFNQGFGGSTLSWGGQVLPFCSLDFEHRPWVEQSDWPIVKSDLENYYRRASSILNVDYLAFSTRSLSKNQHDTGSTSSLKYGFSKWCPQPKLNLTLGNTIKESTSTHLIVNACVDQIHVRSDTKKISHISIVNQAGYQRHIRPTYTVLAAGGLENVRIMLRSALASECLRETELPALGHYYQDHIGYYGAKMTPINLTLFRKIFSTKLISGKKVQPKIFLSKRAQSSKKLLNVTANIGIEQSTLSATNLIKEIYNSETILQKITLAKRSALLILSSLPEVISALYSLFIRKQIHIPKNADFFLIANCESPPLRSSKITLSSEKDRYGYDKALVHWVLDDRSKDSLEYYFVAAKKELELAGVAYLKIMPCLFSETEEWKNHSYSLYHHMGATRMSHSSKDGVVDANCKVHSVANLYIAGTSVLPTSSASNPTYTAIALAIRLADHLVQKLAK